MCREVPVSLDAHWANPAAVCVCPQSFPGVPQQYGLQVGSSVNVMSGPGGPGPGGAGPHHPGQGPYSGQNMQYHGGEKTFLAYTIKPQYAICKYGHLNTSQDCGFMFYFLE